MNQPHEFVYKDKIYYKDNVILRIVLTNSTPDYLRIKTPATVTKIPQIIRNFLFRRALLINVAQSTAHVIMQVAKNSKITPVSIPARVTTNSIELPSTKSS